MLLNQRQVLFHNQEYFVLQIQLLPLNINPKYLCQTQASKISINKTENAVNKPSCIVNKIVLPLQIRISSCFLSFEFLYEYLNF